MKFTDILTAFNAYDDDKRATGWRAACPAHEADRETHSSDSLIIDYNEETKKVLVRCQSQACDLNVILANVGLTPRDLNGPTYVGHSARHVRTRGSRPQVSEDSRRSADGDAFLAALWLSMEVDLRPDGDVARRLRDEFGLDPVGLSPDDAFTLGVGIDRDPVEEGFRSEDAFITMTARTTTGEVAFMQRRDPDPDAKVRWLSGVNPGKGTPDERRWSGVGLIGRRHEAAPVIITEGPSDGLTVAALDAYDVVTFRGAWAATEILDVRDVLIGRDVVVFPDKGTAGEGAALKVIERVAPVANSLRVAQIPDYAKSDVRDVFKHDPATFRERFERLMDEALLFDSTVGVDFNPDDYLGGTDLDRAAALVAWVRAGGFDLAFTDAHGWLYYDKTLWVPGSEPVLMHAQTQLGLRLRLMAEQAQEAEDSAAEARGERSRESGRAKSLYRLSKGFLNALPRTSTLKVLSAMPDVRRRSEDFDAARHLLAVGNGVVDLRTGKLRPMTSRDLLTRRLSIDYDPEAEAPQWEAFLEDVLVDRAGKTDADLVRYMQEVVGYGITGESNRPARYFLFVGGGSNGKSVFTTVLGDVFNSYTKRTAFATFAGRDGEASAGVLSARAGLAGARLIFTSESGKGERFSASFLKDFTGGDPVEAKVMRGNPFVYVPSGLVMTATNHRPDVDSIDNGIWRRLRLVYWRRRVEAHEMDLTLADRLVNEEAKGILAWAVRGAMRYYANGSRALLDEPVSVMEATKSYREDSDVLFEFVDINVIKTGNLSDCIPQPALWLRYRAWCDMEGTKPMGKKNFFQAMEERLGERTARGSGWPQRWEGVLLASAEDVAEEMARMAKSGSLSEEAVDYIRERALSMDDTKTRESLAKYDGLSGRSALRAVND